MLARLLCALLLLAPCALAQTASTQLKLVVILTRHGVRSPTSMMTGYSSHTWPDLEKDWRVECCGDLTPRGAELVFLMGAYYRSYYAQRKLFPALGCVAQQTYIWADNEERPIATANALAQGLSDGLPGCTVPVNSLTFTMKECAGSGSKICQRPSGGQTDLWFHPLPTLWHKVSSKENDDLKSAADDINRRFPQIVSQYRPSLQALQNVLNCCNVSLCQPGTPPCTLLTMKGTATPGDKKAEAP
jgi:4-phytase/acid phosphatase